MLLRGCITHQHLIVNIILKNITYLSHTDSYVTWPTVNHHTHAHMHAHTTHTQTHTHTHIRTSRLSLLDSCIALIVLHVISYLL